MAALQDDEEFARVTALTALGGLREAAWTAHAAAVTARCEDDSPDVRLTAVKVLQAWDHRVAMQSIDALIGLFDDPVPTVRRAAVATVDGLPAVPEDRVRSVGASPESDSATDSLLFRIRVYKRL